MKKCGSSDQEDGTVEGEQEKFWGLKIIIHGSRIHAVWKESKAKVLQERTYYLRYSQF